MTVHVDFCGEIHPVGTDEPLVIGRDGALTIDDNPYLHRRFLEVSRHGGITWLTNVGTRLSATIADGDGLMNAWLAPGAQLPVVFPRALVWFTAGPTTYEFEIVQDEPAYVPTVAEPTAAGETTIGRVAFTTDQRLLMVALAEDVLRRGNRGSGTVLSSADAATRLGWTLTKFNRKLDNVCDKLTKTGVRGLYGDSSKIASNRRARLVEYAVAARLVTRDDLELLDARPVSRED
ncbi:MAG: hypothetical protein ACTHMS_00670 [Jatrophihabitans sp.]|uniref:hypothetical protein n=1 Tax=Jatrophihabitans sp. TaxID=1932789 RepID=UPI003F80C617